MLVDPGNPEIQQWVECSEPVDIASYRDLGVAELAEVKRCAKSGDLTIRGEFRVTTNMLQRVPKVTLMLTEEEVACATLAMHHGVLPYGVTTCTAIMSANAPDISTIDQWLVFKMVPAHGANTKPYMTMAVVLAPQDQGGIIQIDIAVINPIGPYSAHVLD